MTEQPKKRKASSTRTTARVLSNSEQWNREAAHGEVFDEIGKDRSHIWRVAAGRKKSHLVAAALVRAYRRRKVRIPAYLLKQIKGAV